jgi:hypothetical protein
MTPTQRRRNDEFNRLRAAERPPQVVQSLRLPWFLKEALTDEALSLSVEEGRRVSENEVVIRALKDYLGVSSIKDHNERQRSLLDPARRLDEQDR